MRSSDKPTLARHLASRLIALYPAGWRARYAEEMLLVLEDAPPNLKTILNLLIHLFDAHLHRELVQERIPTLLQKMRLSGLTIFGAAMIFLAASFVGQVGIYRAEQTETLLPTLYYTASPLINVLHSSIYVLLLFILIGGLPILLAACWGAIKERKFSALFLCLLGLLSPLGVMILTIIAQMLLQKMGLSREFYTPVTLFILFIGIGLSLALIIFAVQRVEPNRHITRYVFALAIVIPLIMLVCLISLVLGIVPILDYALKMGEIQYIVQRVLLILIMCGAFIFTLTSLRTGFRARQEAR